MSFLLWPSIIWIVLYLLKVGDVELDHNSFSEWEGTPELASGKPLPGHGIFPTWFVEVPIGDIAKNEAAEVKIEVDSYEDLMVHFDAYGEGRPKKCKGKPHHKHCKGESHHKNYKGKSHHKDCMEKSHHKHCKGKYTCFHDVYNSFSHDVTVVVGDSAPLPECEPEQLSISFVGAPEGFAIRPSDPDYILYGSFKIGVSAERECNMGDLVVAIDLPVWEISSRPLTLGPVFINVIAEQEGVIDAKDAIVNISWANLPIPAEVSFEGQLHGDITVSASEIDWYTVNAYFEDGAGNKITGSDVTTDFYVVGDFE